MKSRKVGDSYAKRAGRTGILNSGPSDRDLADQIGSAQVLIGAVVSGSDGWGSKGEWGGGGTPPEQSSAAAGSSEMPNPAFPWPVWTAARLWSMPVARVSHWDY